MNKNKTVFITGSSRGIGKAIAKKFAENNFNVIINCSKSIKELSLTEKELKKINPNIISIKKDISIYENVVQILKEVKKIDILINNAGISYVGLFTEMKFKDYQKLINTNLYGVINCSHIFLPEMIKQKNGCIINISSIWGKVGASCETIYSATKGAVNSFTKSLAKELGPSNIRVNAISCGAIDTDMNKFLSEEEKQDFTNNIPLMRFGKSEEVAELALFLSSNKSNYLTGEIINLDGGFI